MAVPGRDRHRRTASWHFDADGAREEVLLRRIGQNELDVIDLMHGYVRAQAAYRAENPDGDGLPSFAAAILERRQAKLEIGTIDDPGVTHNYVAQVAQTDWEFLKGRATEIGYETGVADGKFYFRPAPGMSRRRARRARPPPRVAAASAVGLGDADPHVRREPALVAAPDQLVGLVSEAEVRVWDPQGVQVVSGKAPLASKTADVDDEPGALAGAYGGPISLPAIPSIPFLPSFLGASNDAYTIVDRPLAWGSNAQSAADAVAKGWPSTSPARSPRRRAWRSQTPGITAGEQGQARQRADAVRRATGTSRRPATSSTSRSATTCRFEVSGRHDRSLHGLVTGGHLDIAEHGD